MTLILLIAIVALLAYLLLGERHVKVREIARITYFAALLALLVQYGVYFDSLLKR